MWASLQSAMESIDNQFDELAADERDLETSEELDDACEEEEDTRKQTFLGEMKGLLFGNDDDAEFTPDMEAARRISLPETFTEPLVVDVPESPEKSNEQHYMELNDLNQFVDTFDIDEKTDEISRLLANDGDEDLTQLQEQFRLLSPEHVSYKDFWTRYFFRCDPERIEREWQRHDEMEENARRLNNQKREEALKEVSDAALNLLSNAASNAAGRSEGQFLIPIQDTSSL